MVSETGNYWVLARVPSSSSAEVYELRTSKNDGKTYCTCKGWIFKARKGDGICKHIAGFKREQPAEQVIVYSFDEFIKVKRAITIIDDMPDVSKQINVRRK